MKQSQVYFIKDITPENLVRIYEALGATLAGRVAVNLIPGRRATRIISDRSL